MSRPPSAHGVLGKGGVGKTTLALALGHTLAQRGPTLVVSLDPAHNLGDLAGVALTDRPRRIASRLWLAEVDVDARRTAYRERLRAVLRSRFPRLSWLAQPLEEAALVPGDEETALLQALDDALQDTAVHFVVLDMPPTGLSLRIFRWARYRMAWVRALRAWRERILRDRARVHRLWGYPEEEDELLQRMGVLEQEVAAQWNRLKAVHWWVVTTPDPLARREAHRIQQAFQDLDLPLAGSIPNRDPSGIPESSRPVDEARRFWEARLGDLPTP